MKQLMRGIREINSIQPHLIFLLFSSAVIDAVLPFVGVFFTSKIITGIYNGEEAPYLVKLAVIGAGIVFVGQILSGVIQYAREVKLSCFNELYNMKMGMKTMSLKYEDVESAEVQRKYQTIKEYQNFNGAGLWKIINTLPQAVGDTVAVVSAAALTAKLFLEDGGEFSGGIGYFICSWQMSIILAAAIVLSAVASMKLNGKAMKKVYDVMGGMAVFNRVVFFYTSRYVLSYHSGKDIRLYDESGLITDELEKSRRGIVETMNQIVSSESRYRVSGSILAGTVMMLAYIFIAVRAAGGIIEIGEIILYINTIAKFSEATTDMFKNIGELKGNREAIDAYFDYMDLKEAEHIGEKEFGDPGNNFVLTLKNVSYRYPGTEEYALRNISLEIRAGEKAALVGVNGSGKSTLIKLLCRMYEGYDGEILLNGTEIRQFRYDEYLDFISAVFQDYSLFSFTVGENVAGVSEYDENAVKSALSDAGLDERFITGLNTYLYKDFDETGIEISGGEGQKIAIARGLYKKAPLLILDEPTAALDPISEENIYSNLYRTTEGRTVIFISHRLSSCKVCDRIFVLDKGSLIQQGTHNELLAERNGKYSELWNAQAKWYQKNV